MMKGNNMKWKTKEQIKNTNWHEHFVWWFTKTEDGYTVIFETVWRKWKVHMSDGYYVFRTEKP